VRISMCHCLECQRRTGAVASNQARFRRHDPNACRPGRRASVTRRLPSGREGSEQRVLGAFALGEERQRLTRDVCLKIRAFLVRLECCFITKQFVE
jgi:hypothetical protein